MAVLTYRSVKGSALTVAEADDNIHNLDDRITVLEDNPVDPITPTSIGMTGTSFTMGLSNGDTLGPISFTIPMPRFRGPWTALTSYQQLNFFIAPDGALGAVMYDHVSEAVFDWGLEVDTAGDLAYRNISGSATGTLAGLADVAITSPAAGDALLYDADAEEWVNGQIATALDDLTDVVITPSTLADGQSLVYDVGTEQWINGDVSPDLDDLKREYLYLLVGDETTTITTGTSKLTFRMPFGGTLVGLRANLATQSSSGVVTVDVNNTTLSILSTKLTIDANERTSVTATTPHVVSISSMSDDDEITIDVDTAGTGAKGLKILLVVRRT